MSQSIRVTTLVENTARGVGILAEHGLAFWIEIGRRHVLFDTGQGMALCHNAERLGVPLASADAIVLSHGHFDHTGGLADALGQAAEAKVYAHPAAFDAKYARNDDGTARDIRMPLKDAVAVREVAAELVETCGPAEVVKGLFVTGEAPRETEFEDTGGPFFLDEKCREPDPLIDDQAMFFETSEGIVVLLGCAHAGVVNTLRYVQRLTDGKPIHTVAGGMHLAGASDERIERTVDAFRELGIQFMGPAHCTGMAPTAALWSAFPGQCFPCATGTRMEFEV